MDRRFKPYEELEFTDDFMFAAVMNSSKEICRQVIELILKRKIKGICYPDYQHSIIIRYDSRGVRLDVTVTDMDGTVFDLEMQAVKEAELPRRCRYYHGMLSMEQVEKGEGISLNDGAKTVFLNAACDTDELSGELKAFVEYLKTGICDTDDGLVNAIDRSVTEVRENVKWRSEYMTFEVRLMEERMKAREEERVELLASLVKDGILTLSDAVKRSGLSEEDFKKYLEQAEK